MEPAVVWLNSTAITAEAIHEYQHSIATACPHFVVIDSLFSADQLNNVVQELHCSTGWESQRHSYAKLYVDQHQWASVEQEQRFVQRDLWQRQDAQSSVATQFLQFLRSDTFLRLLSKIFQISLTDISVADTDINTNYFRLASSDFVNQHADESPGRKVCMLLYLNQDWASEMGGELGFSGASESKPVYIEPSFNRCVLFDPSSIGSEHWVESVNAQFPEAYRYNVTSWYWSE